MAFAVVLYLSSGPLDDPDVWWHVRLGKLILHSHRIPGREAWSYAARGHVWTPTAWLSDVLYGSLAELGGYRALIALKLVVCGLAGVLILRLCRRTGATPPSLAIAFVLTLLPLSFFLRERPQAISLLFVAWLAGRCEAVRRGETVRLPSFLAVQWLWANVHGMWLLGPAFLMVAALANLADTGRAGLRRFERHILLAIAAVGVAALTPVGPRLVVQPFLVHSAARSISEWQPTVLWQASLAPYLIAIAIVVAALGHRNTPRTWAEPLWLIAVVAFSLIATRDVAPAMILLAAPLARGLDDISSLPATIRMSPLVPGAVALAGVALAAIGAGSEPAIAPGQPTGLVRELGMLPAPRHVLNDYTIGGLITGTQPDASVSIDGRTDNYSPSYVADYLAALQLRGRWQQLLATLEPDCALLRRDSAMTHVLLTEYHWRMVDEEDGYVLLERGTGSLPDAPVELHHTS